MAVWKSVSYRDSALQFFGRNLPVPAFHDGTLTKFAQFHTDFSGELSPGIVVTERIFADNFKHAPHLLAQCVPNPGRFADSALHQTVRDVRQAHWGISAVYLLLARLYPHITPEVYDDKAELEAHIFTIGMAGGYHSRGDVDLRLPFMRKLFNSTYLPAKGFIKAFKRVAAFHKNKGHFMEMKYAHLTNKPLPRVSGAFTKYFPGLDVYTFRGTVILIDMLKDNMYFLQQKDIDRMEKFVVGLASAKIYINLYGQQNPTVVGKMMRAYNKWVSLVLSLFTLQKKEDFGWICRAFDVAYHLFLAKHACDVDDQPLKEQIAKYNRDNLDRIVSYQEILNVVEGLAFKESLEILQLYKLFPANDFDSYSMASKQQALYDKWCPKHAECHKTEDFTNVIHYMKWLLIVAFHDKHGLCPGFVKEPFASKDVYWINSYPHVHPNKIPFHDVEQIDLDGDFMYESAGIDPLKLVKDKAICPKSIRGLSNSDDLAKLPIKEKTQLLNVLTQQSMPDINMLADNFSTLFLDVKADDKPEAKKPDGRWFFEAHTDARLVLSEYESSNANYAVHVPGAIVGRDARR